MKIIVLTGSPREKGNSNFLASEFIFGAQEKGHEVFRFDAAKANIHACIGCESCHMDGPCIFNDDFELIRRPLLEADLIAFATPLYYFGFSAQLKTVIDRFFSINKRIKENKQAVLLVSFANPDKTYVDALVHQYETMLRFLKWIDKGQILASPVRNICDVQSTKFVAEAHSLGQSI